MAAGPYAVPAAQRIPRGSGGGGGGGGGRLSIPPPVIALARSVAAGESPPRHRSWALPLPGHVAPLGPNVSPRLLCTDRHGQPSGSRIFHRAQTSAAHRLPPTASRQPPPSVAPVYLSRPRFTPRPRRPVGGLRRARAHTHTLQSSTGRRPCATASAAGRSGAPPHLPSNTE